MPSISATTYARWRATTLGRITEQLEVELVRTLVGPVADLRLLDVGTGDGTYALAMAKGGALVTALDPAEDMLSAARDRARGEGVEIDLRRGEAERLPFTDGSFDAVIAVTVLCLVHDPAVAVAEMARVLAPGGLLVLGDLGSTSPWALWRRVKRRLGAKAWQGVRFWSRTELAALVETAGLQVESTRGAVCYPPSGWAASMLARVDASVCRAAPSFAAFLAVVGRKPGTRTSGVLDHDRRR